MPLPSAAGAWRRMPRSCRRAPAEPADLGQVRAAQQPFFLPPAIARRAASGPRETMKTLISATATIALFLALALAPASADPAQDKVNERYYDAQGRLVSEVGIRTDNDAIGFTRVYHHADSARGNGGIGSSSQAATDCAATKYVLGGWHWTAPYSAKASSFASQFNAAGSTWDAATSASIFGGITSGSAGPAGTLDGNNQIDMQNLGATTTIAVTTTWYYRGSGEAVESDGQYNTFYTWSTSGAAGSMDVQNIGTHEIGHTFGLNHPKGPGVGCLTMYAYANTGETAKRTLGDGDILGIRALYGA